MTNENFSKALSIITASNNAKVSFNVPSNGSYVHASRIVINSCNASLTKELIDAGFSLFLSEGIGIVVEKFD
jgi:hypothetical protein